VFQLRPDLKVLNVVREQIVAIIESINTPMVAAGDRSNQKAKAFIVGVRTPAGQFSLFIYLHLLDTRECLIYQCQPPETPMDGYHDLELEALQFVESMGFMVDNLHFRNLPADQQVSMLQGLPFNHTDLQAFAKLDASANEATAEDSEAGVDLSPLEEDVIELEDVADAAAAPPPVPEKVVPKEGLTKIIRLLASF
jgi:hypothetical protein